MFAPYRSPLICTIAVMLALLTGCGQKGPLFMPVKQPVTPAPVTPQPAMPAPATSAVPANGAAATPPTSAPTPSPR